MAYTPNDWLQWSGRIDLIEKMTRLEIAVAELAQVSDEIDDNTSLLVRSGTSATRTWLDYLYGGRASIYFGAEAPEDPHETLPWWNTVDNTLSRWDETTEGWVSSGGGGGIFVSETAPEDPADGDVWWDSLNGGLFRFDGVYLDEWAPVGQPSPNIGYLALGLGKASPGQPFSVSIGSVDSNTPTGYSGVSIGQDALAPASYDIAIGGSAKASVDGSYQIVLGYGAESQSANTIVAGSYAKAEKDGYNQSASTVVLGSNTRAIASSNAVAIGSFAKIDNVSNSVAIGDNVVVENNTEDSYVSNAVAIGPNASTGGTNNTALGSSSEADGEYGATAVGSFANAEGQNSTAVGSGAAAYAMSSTALGNSANAVYEYSIAIGPGAYTTQPSQALIAATQLWVQPGWGDDLGLDSTLVLHSPDGEAHTLSVDNDGNFGPVASGGGGGGGGGGMLTADVLVPALAWTGTTASVAVSGLGTAVCLVMPADADSGSLWGTHGIVASQETPHAVLLTAATTAPTGPLSLRVSWWRTGVAQATVSIPLAAFNGTRNAEIAVTGLGHRPHIVSPADPESAAHWAATQPWWTNPAPDVIRAELVVPPTSDTSALVTIFEE